MDLQGFLSVGDSAVLGVLGYLVVFLGLVLLMLVVFILTRIMIARSKKAAAEAPAEAAPAPGSAGDLKLYDTDPKDAAMIMAIVADSLGKPLNELRFKSIKEVKDK